MTPPEHKPSVDPAVVPDSFSAGASTETLRTGAGVIHGRYSVLRPLGSGAMGEVLLCRDSVLDLMVAVKFPRLDPGGRFLDEARHASRLNHPNIARLYHFDYERGGRPFIVMEYVEGRPLSELLKDGKLPVDRSLHIIDSVLAALEEAHRSGIIHRDIKPSNIMITPAGLVKVLDFGLSKRIREAPDSGDEHDHTQADVMGRTKPGVVVGTPRYMSPEQARGEEHLDERCDIFATGAVLFECLTGRPAFISYQARMLGDVAAPSSLAPDISSELDRVVLKALSQSLESRYRDAAAMRRELPRPKSPGRLLHKAKEWTLQSVKRPRRLAIAVLALVFLYFSQSIYYRTMELFDRHSPEATRLYEDGLAALRDGTYYRASLALERAVAIEPKFYIARARLAESLFELEYTDRAQSELLRVVGEAGATGNNALVIDALRLTFSRNLPEAVNRYQQLVDRSSGAEKSAALVDLGRTLERNNQPQEALAKYHAAIARNSAYPAAFLRSGILLDRLKRSDESEQAFHRAEELYQVLSNTEGQAEMWYQRGRLAADHRRTKDAKEALDRSLMLAKSAGSVYQEIQAMLQISGVQNLQARMVDAEKTALDAIDLARRAGIANLAARGSLSLGNAYLAAGQYDKAEPEFRELLDFSRQHELGRFAALALFSLASLHSQMGRTTQVLDEVDEAAKFFRQGGYAREVNQCVILRTRALRQMGRYEEALEAARAQINAAGPGADPAQMATFEDTIASTATVLERYPGALASYQKVEQVSRSLDDKVGVAFALAALARVSGRMGDFDAAPRYLEDAARIAGAESGMKSLLALIPCVRSEVELARGRNQLAIEMARTAISLAGTQQKKIGIEARLTLVLALARSGSGRTAAKAARELVSLAGDYGEPYLKSQAQLALAEAALSEGNAAEARAAAASASASFTAADQLDSAWRSEVLLSEALRKLGETAAAEDAEHSAKTILSRLQSTWPPDTLSQYLARPDLEIPRYRRFTQRRTAYVSPLEPFWPSPVVAGGLPFVSDFMRASPDYAKHAYAHA